MDVPNGEFGKPQDYCWAFPLDSRNKTLSSSWDRSTDPASVTAREYTLSLNDLEIRHDTFLRL